MSDLKTFLDTTPLKGADATYHSLSSQVEFISHHLHRKTRGMGVAVAPSGETNIADMISAGGVTPFTLTSGNNDYGAWTQIMGSNDTPLHTGGLFFDIAEIAVTAVNDNAFYVMQISWGESANLAAQITAGNYSEFPIKRDSAAVQTAKETLAMIPLPAGTKVWARLFCIGQNAKTASFYFGVHEYTA